MLFTAFRFDEWTAYGKIGGLDDQSMGWARYAQVPYCTLLLRLLHDERKERVTMVDDRNGSLGLYTMAARTSCMMSVALQAK